MNPTRTACSLVLCAAVWACEAPPSRLAAEAFAQAASGAASNDALRQRLATPGRAPLLRSPFGPAPRGPLLATRAQADTLARELDGAVTWVTVQGVDDAAIKWAIGQAVVWMVVEQLADDAPVFVGGDDAASSARVVERLGAMGLTQVILLTPQFEAEAQRAVGKR